MSKNYLKHINKSTSFNRATARQFYIDKYFNLWYNQYEWKGLDYRQIDCLMIYLWSVGKVAFSVIAHTDEIAVTDFAAQTYDMFNQPVQVRLIPKRDAQFLQKKVMMVDKDCVIGYAQRNRKPISAPIMYKIDELVDIEMLIKVSQNTLKSPYLVTCSKEDEEALNAIFERIMADEPIVYASIKDINAIKTLVNSNPYILDKLLQFKNERENELLTYLGINNVQSEKKEHLIVDEVNANNQMIQESGNCCLDSLKELCERAKEVLNIDISVDLRNKPEEIELEGDEEDDNSDDVSE